MLSAFSKSKKPSPRVGYGPLSALLVTIAAFFGSQVFAGLIIGAYIALFHKDADHVMKLLTDTTSGQFAYIACIEIFTLGILYWFMRTRGITLATIGLGRKPRLGDLGNAAIWFVGYFILLALIMAVVGAYIPAVDVDQEQQLGFESVQGFVPLLLVFISLVVFPPIVEEVLIRGFLYSGLRQKWTRVVSAIVASFLFGLAHLQLGSGAPPLYVAAIDTFFLSIVLIALREKTGSLWAGMIVHAFKNGFAFIALFILQVR